MDLGVIFYLKKDVFPPLPFYVGRYKFSKVKSAPEFMKKIEIFHFSEKSFHRNDSQGKVAAHHALSKVKFKYIDHIDKDELVYWNICNMTTLNNRIRRKITISRGKGSDNNNP